MMELIAKIVKWNKGRAPRGAADERRGSRANAALELLHAS
jgi:hypothetical protein